MSNDKSLENLNIAKVLIYTLSFLFICAVLILLLLIPNLNSYKMLKIKLNTQSMHNARVKGQLDALKADIKNLQDTNFHTFKQYNTLFSEEDLAIFLKKYLKNIKMKSIKVEKEPYLHYEFEVSSVIKDPLEFLDLVENIHKNKNLLKIALPVSMELRSKNKLNLKFKIKVYSLLN